MFSEFSEFFTPSINPGTVGSALLITPGSINHPDLVPLDNQSISAVPTKELDFPARSFDAITACQCFWYFDHEKSCLSLRG